MTLRLETNYQLVLNPEKTKFMLSAQKLKRIIGDAKLHIDGLEIEQVKQVYWKFLGVIINLETRLKN